MPSLNLDPSTTALLVVDLQTKFMGVQTQPRTTDAVVENAARLAKALRGKGAWVAWIGVAGSDDGRDLLHPLLDAAPPAVAGQTADGAGFPAGLGVLPADAIVLKKQWGAFFGTDLDLQLRRRGLKTVVLAGVATCMGVESTARAAYERGYQQVFVEDAMASFSAAEHEHTVSVIFPRLGRVRSTQEVLAGLAL